MLISPSRTRANRITVRVIGSSAAILLGSSILVTSAFAQTAAPRLAADCSAYASVPLPAEAEKAPVPKKSPVCASYRSYRGIGRPVNYAEARACAWQERLAQKANLGQNPEEPTAWVVGGSLILADLYFNGAGVKRDIPLAMHFACEYDKDMANFALEELAKQDASTSPKKPFELCDYATTTFTMNFCSGYASHVEAARRSRYYDSLKSSMDPEQRAAFEKLLAAQNAYVDAHAEEVYQAGTIHVIRTLASQAILDDLFRTDLVHFERKQWPTLSDNQVASADELMRRTYEQTLRKLKPQPNQATEDGEVSPDELSTAQQAWEAYRNAWVSFAHLRYPTAAERIRAKVTLDRYRLLKTIP